MSGRGRRYVLVLAGSIVVVAAIFAFDAATAPDQYRTHIDFTMNDVVLPSAHWDPQVSALAPAEAMARAVDFAQGDRVQRAVDHELRYPYTLSFAAAGDHTLRITAEAAQPSLAVNAAVSAASIFGRTRAEVAAAEARRVIPALQAQVDATTGQQHQDALGRLHGAQDTVRLGPAGAPAGTPSEPCCPLAKGIPGAVARGATVGLLVGALLVGLLWLEDRRRAVTEASGDGHVSGDGHGVAESASGAGASVITGGPRGDEPDEPSPEPALVDGTGRWVGPGIVTALVLGRSLVYAVLGPRFILDDWLILYRRRYLGVLDAIQHRQVQQLPVKWLTQTVLFGLAGRHPLVLFALLTLLNLGAALALYYAVARFFPAPVPVLVAGLWVITANHSTLTVWAAASQGVMAVALCCVGITLLSKGRWLVALAALTGSMLSYEFTIPICVAAAALVGTRWARPRPGLEVAREVLGWRRAAMVAWLVLVVGWMSQHPTYPIKSRHLNLWDTWAGHVSSGLVSTDSAPTLLLRAMEVGVAVGLGLCLVAWLRGDRGRGRGPALALCGTAVMALGLATTLLVPGGTFGLFNRLYGASSVGTAMLLTGVGLAVWYRLRTAGVLVALGLMSLCIVGQVVALRAVHQGGEDVLALLRHLDRTSQDPANTSYLVGPRPEHDGFYAVDQFFGLYPYKLAYPDGDGNLRLAATPDDFDHPEPGEVRVTWDDVLGR